MSKGVHFGIDFYLYRNERFCFFIYKQERKATNMNSIEGQIRIPSGCAIAAVISKVGKKMTGESDSRVKESVLAYQFRSIFGSDGALFLDGEEQLERLEK